MSVECIFKMIGKIISESVRFILFFASLLFLLCSVVMLLYSSQIQTTYALVQVTDIDTSLIAIIVLAVYLVGLSIFAIHGTFFRSKSSIEWFSLLASLNVLICLGILMYTSPSLLDSRDLVQSNLQKFQQIYDWSHDVNSNQEAKMATEMWDSLQTSRQCCGVKSYEDWDSIRPANSSTLYPISCCVDAEKLMANKKPCNDKDDIWTFGCYTIMSGYVSSVSILLTLLTWSNLVLSIMACLVIFFQPKTQYYDYS